MKRESLVRLKTLKADCERNIRECKAKAEQQKAEGKDAEPTLRQLTIYEKRLASISQSVEKAESDYIAFTHEVQKKKLELNELKAKMAGLHAELSTLNGGDASWVNPSCAGVRQEGLHSYPQ